LDGKFEKKKKFIDKGEQTQNSDWMSLNIKGFTYISPENLEQTLKEYEMNNNFFLKSSFHFVCNNSFDFIHWCLKILIEDNGKRLVPSTKLTFIKDNYQLKLNLNNNINSILWLDSLENMDYEESLYRYNGQRERFSKTILNYLNRREDTFYRDYFLHFITVIVLKNVYHTLVLKTQL